MQAAECISRQKETDRYELQKEMDRGRAKEGRRKRERGVKNGVGSLAY